MTVFEKWTSEDCKSHRYQMFIEGCITKEELDALLDLDGVPLCVNGRLYVWSQCSVLGG